MALDSKVTTGAHGKFKLMNLRDYQARIVEIALKKGWSTDLYWLVAKTSIEFGEFVIAVEKVERAKAKLKAENASESEIARVLAGKCDSLAKEYGDLIVTTSQLMYKYKIDLDKAVNMVIGEIQANKKTTINAAGEIEFK